MTAEAFVLDAARTLREKGRDVQLSRDVDELLGESWEYFTASSLAPEWFGASIIVSARKYRGRWAFCGVTIRTASGEKLDRKDYRAARVALEVYA